jgi:hypothetical protein
MFDISSFNLTGFQNLPDFVIYVINFAVSASIVIAVVSLIVSGFKYILSSGDEKKVKAATQSLAFSLLGLVLVFIAPMVIKYILYTILEIK